MQRPGFWDDSEQAARTSAAHAAAQRRLQTFRSLESDRRISRSSPSWRPTTPSWPAS